MNEKPTMMETAGQMALPIGVTWGASFLCTMYGVERPLLSMLSTALPLISLFLLYRMLTNRLNERVIATSKNLILIPGGALNGLPAALWSGSEADRLFREWRDSFDYIFIDSSAAASASDSALIARLADGCVFVTQTDRVDKAAVRKGAGAVSDAGCEIIGCILNADH